MTAAPQPAVRGVGLSQVFDGRTIYRGVSFEVARGQVYVILGGSGSGKSTLMKQAIGLLRPAAGRIEVLGRDMYGDGELAGMTMCCARSASCSNRARCSARCPCFRM